MRRARIKWDSSQEENDKLSARTVLQLIGAQKYGGRIGGLEIWEGNVTTEEGRGRCPSGQYARVK